MELELLDKKLRRLVCKLRKHDIFLEVFDHTDIEYGDMLGKGGEAEVRECKVTYNNVAVDAAVKTVLDNTDDAISITLDEIELLCLARDPIINTTLQVYGVAAVPDEDDPVMGHLVIVTEAGLMNALQLYQQEDLSLSITLDLWSRLSAALYTMHFRRIIHHDMKPENILITALNRDRNGHIEKIDFKVIDLGMGKRVYTDHVVTDDILGTHGYHAPEVLQEETYDFKADIFMLGITFCVLLFSPSFLRSKTLVSKLLKEIHAAKKRSLTGRILFEDVIAPKYDENHSIPSAIVDMICEMLEKQEKRTITLLDVIDICSRESKILKSKEAAQSPDGACANCQQDSGISSGDRQQSKQSKLCTPATRKRRGRCDSTEVSDSVLGSSHTNNTRTSIISTAGSSDRTVPRKGSRELDGLFEPWMGEKLGNRRGTKRSRQAAKESVDGNTGYALRKRTRRQYFEDANDSFV